MENNAAESTPQNGPARVIRDGRLKITIWRNEGEKGPYASLVPAKTITGKDGQPRDIHSFSETENLRIEKLCNEAHMELRHIKRQWSQEQSQSQDQERDAFKQTRTKSNGHNIQEQSQGF